MTTKCLCIIIPLVISFDKKASSINYNLIYKIPGQFPGTPSSLFLPTYPGLGHYHNFGGNLGSFNISNKSHLSYGAFISAQYGFLFSTKQIVTGANFTLRYIITNHLQFQTWGQYLTPGNSLDPTFDLPYFFPTNNFGAGLKYDSNKKTKIKVGIEYQFDKRDKIWKPESGRKVLLKF